MITKRYSSREEWLNDRLGRITGSRLKDVLPGRSESRKKGFWELVAERLINSAAINDEENAMDRGTRLEPEALARFIKETGKKVDGSLIMWQREDDTSIALSPDGVIGKTAAVEIKCLNAASHSEALFTGKIPKNMSGYEEQALHYFITNDKLTNLFYVFYDPRFPAGLDFFYLTLKRKDFKKQIEETFEMEKAVLKDVREIVNQLSERIQVEVIQVVAKETGIVEMVVANGIEFDTNAGLDAVYQGMKERS